MRICWSLESEVYLENYCINYNLLPVTRMCRDKGQGPILMVFEYQSKTTQQVATIWINVVFWEDYIGNEGHGG